MHVAIVALGPSAQDFYVCAEAEGYVRKFCDQVYGINTNGSVLNCDIVFHMDDVRIQEIRAIDDPNSKIANMLEWMKTYDGRVITSRAHPDYPCLEEFPLEDVIKSVGTPYFNSTAAYAIAYAMHKGATKISCFGMDYTYPNMSHAEQGRGCCEFWIGRALERGIEIMVSGQSSLLDNCLPLQERLYGYDTVKLDIEIGNGTCTVKKEIIEDLPTAKDIEMAYDHSEFACRVEFDGTPSGSEALDRLLHDYPDVTRILDIGCGDGLHAKIMAEAGKDVLGVAYTRSERWPDTLREPWIGDFKDFPAAAGDQWDAIWAAHVLEHQPDPGQFLRKCFDLLRDDGVLAITIPPPKANVVGGHVALFNAGTLLYNLIMAGFDCSEARVSGLYSHGRGLAPYNRSVIVRKKPAKLPDLLMDNGDIERLRKFFPLPVEQGFDGELLPIKWQRMNDVQG